MTERSDERGGELLPSNAVPAEDGATSASPIANIPPELQQAMQSGTSGFPPLEVMAAVASVYRSPLPPASEMRAYEEVLPGSAHRILTMAEEQSRHRQTLERTAVDGNSRRSWWGLWLGFVISMSAIGAAVSLALTGHEAAGVALGGIDIAALASVFVIGRIDQRRERVEKDAATRPVVPSSGSN